MARVMLNDSFKFEEIYYDGYSVFCVNKQLRICTFNLVEATYSFTLGAWSNGGADPNCFIAVIPTEYRPIKRAEGVLLCNDGTLGVICTGLSDYTHVEIRPLAEPIVAGNSMRAYLQWFF